MKLAAAYWIASITGSTVIAKTIAQIVPAGAEGVWQVAMQSGFNACLIVLLLLIGRGEVRRQTEAIDRNTKGLTQVVLALAFLPKQFHEQAHALNEEIHDAEKERGK